MIYLGYERGTVTVRGDVRVPNTSWDARSNCFRGLALHYRDIVEYLARSGMVYEDAVLDLVPCPVFRKPSLRLRDYQEDALSAWLRAGKRGTIVLPTGAGKTVVAIEAISLSKTPALVIVPTLDLMDQWATRLREEFGVPIGLYGGGNNQLEALTVATYDTAYLRAAELGNRFAFLIFDEVHHLPAPGYAAAAEMFASPYRMGLTATYEREDGLHTAIPRLVGGKVYEVRTGELSGKHLAGYDLEIVKTDLTQEEKEEHDRYYGQYLGFLRRSGITLRTPADFQRFVMRSGRDREARKALLARHKARMIALNSEGKIEALREVMKRHSAGTDRIIVFTEHNALVHRISRDFLIPSITHRTPKEERQHVLESFRTGKYSKVVTSKVLDEGVDVPEANVGIILSGTGSTREYRQRLGRLLRKKESKRAVLYEIVSRGTSEVGTSRRRHTPVSVKLRDGESRRKKTGAASGGYGRRVDSGDGA